VRLFFSILRSTSRSTGSTVKLAGSYAVIVVGNPAVEYVVRDAR
jgi:hypothetical protein